MRAPPGDQERWLYERPGSVSRRGAPAHAASPASTIQMSLARSRSQSWWRASQYRELRAVGRPREPARARPVAQHARRRTGLGCDHEQARRTIEDEVLAVFTREEVGDVARRRVLRFASFSGRPVIRRIRLSRDEREAGAVGRPLELGGWLGQGAHGDVRGGVIADGAHEHDRRGRLVVFAARLVQQRDRAAVGRPACQ